MTSSARRCASSANRISSITEKNRANARWPTSTTFATPSDWISRSNSRIRACVLSRSDDTVKSGNWSASATSPGLSSNASTGPPLMRRKSATRRARKVLPVAGRGDATMNTGVHGRVGASAPQSGRSSPMAASTDWLWLSATFTVPMQDIGPAIRPAARCGRTPPDGDLRLRCDGYLADDYLARLRYTTWRPTHRERSIRKSVPAPDDPGQSERMMR